MNKLNQETSPYLLQHKDNPVHWYPWSEEAFEIAKQEDKLVFLSIGYSTCYWCHVMEKDSFEKQAVADVLNSKFISIKVDREERPDVDQIYMSAIQALTGQGGWPMSVFLTPDKKAFWGGTFFYRDQFISILQQLSEAWINRRAEIEDSSEHLTMALSQQPEMDQQGFESELVIEQACAALVSRFDEQWGGFGQAPKFPPSLQLGFLLRLYNRDGHDNLLKVVDKTLNAMVRGGMYDHLGGGFARYSTDREWKQPHFEKMLYDNALLSLVYTEAYQISGKLEWATTAKEVLAYVSECLKSPEAAFYSAEDAGEVGREGEFYVFKYEELTELFSSEELSIFERFFDVNTAGNFEHGTNIIYLKNDAELFKCPRSILDKLKEARDRRERPHRDEKILTAWNALMVKSFARAYQVYQDTAYLDTALACTEFLLNTLKTETSLYRSYSKGKASHSACLDDYAFFIEALLVLYEASFDTKYLIEARQLQALQDELWNPSQSAYYYSNASDLPLKQTEFFDGAIPSANAVSLRNLMKLYIYFGDSNFKERYDALVNAFASSLKSYPVAIPSLLQDLVYSTEPQTQLVLNDPNNEIDRFALWSKFNSNNLFILIKNNAELIPLLKNKEAIDGKSTLYICSNNTCSEPIVGEAIKLVPGNFLSTPIKA